MALWQLETVFNNEYSVLCDYNCYITTNFTNVIVYTLFVELDGHGQNDCRHYYNFWTATYHFLDPSVN